MKIYVKIFKATFRNAPPPNLLTIKNFQSFINIYHVILVPYSIKINIQL